MKKLRVQGSLNALQFRVRERWLGKWTIRKGLPPGVDSEAVLRERQYYRLLLSRTFSEVEAQKVRVVVDVGCRNGAYLAALAEFFPHSKLIGVELDWARRYWNFFRRIDFAEAYARVLRDQGRDVQVFGKDFLDLSLDLSLELPGTPEKTENLEAESLVFSFFFPFVSENPCLKWGLPTRFVNFGDLLRHVQVLSAPFLSKKEGRSFFCLSAHQGEWEEEEALLAYQQAQMDVARFRVSPQEFSGLWPSPYETRLIRSVTWGHV